MDALGIETLQWLVFENGTHRQRSMTPLANEQRDCVPRHRKKKRIGFECG